MGEQRENIGLGLLAVGGAAVLIALRLWAWQEGGGWWGVNLLRFLPGREAILWVVASLLVLGGGVAVEILRGTQGERIKKLAPFSPPRWTPFLSNRAGLSVAILFLLLLFLLRPVPPPLLGDGMTCIQATPSGFDFLRKEAAPLAFSLHLLLFKLLPDSPHGAAVSESIWRFTSYLLGALAAGFTATLAVRRGQSMGERCFFFLSVFGSGTLLFFFGYVETYVSLAAAIYGFLLLLELTARGAVRRPFLLPAFVLLVGLHYFMVLLLPALLFALYRCHIWTPSRRSLILLAALLLPVGVFLAWMVAAYYRGLRIFVSSDALFSAYHLVGFTNQHLLACPALPLLLLLLLFPRRPRSGADLLSTFTGLASLVLVLFFFFLRPVIGPAADWDLFALPSLFYTPWLALQVMERMRPGGRLLLPAALLSVLVGAVGPWVSVNVQEKAALERYEELMEWEARFNRFAASYGYYQLAQYHFHRHGLEAKEEIDRALERGLEINPTYAALHKLTASLYFRRGDEERGRREMALYHRLRAEDYLEKKKYAEAAEEYEKAAAYQSPSPEIINTLIELYEGPLADTVKAERWRLRQSEQ